MGFLDALLGKREAAAPAAHTMVGFPDTGGLVFGVTADTVLGLSSVRACLNILSTGVCQMVWHERRGTLDLPPSRLVRQPYGQITRRDWTDAVVRSLALFDIAYLLKIGGEDAEGVPMGLAPIDPNMVMPISYSTAVIQPSAEYWVGGVRVPRDRLVILRRSLQLGVPEGMGGLLRQARVTFAAAIAGEAFASRYWQGGGSANIALETEAMVSPEQAQEMSDAWAVKRSRGPDYVPVLAGGLHANNLGIDPTTASAVEARRELVADIGRYFGVPTRILNAPTGDSETYTSTEASNQDMVRYTLQDYRQAIEDAISEQLPGGRYLFLDPSSLTMGTQLARAQAWQLSTGNKAWIDIDEVREAEGLPPAEDPEALNPPAPAPVQQNQEAQTNGQG